MDGGIIVIKPILLFGDVTISCSRPTHCSVLMCCGVSVTDLDQIFNYPQFPGGANFINNCRLITTENTNATTSDNNNTNNNYTKNK